MRDLFAQFISYLRGIWRYRWLAMLVAWIVTISGWVYVHQMPDQYQSTARVFVDTRSILKPLLRGLTVESDASRQIRLMTRILLSRPNLEKVARMTDLDLKVQNDNEMNRLVDELAQQISIGQAQGAQENLYRISASYHDPQLAKRIVQSLLTIFVENTLGETRKDSDTAQRFLEEQIKDYEQRLVAAERRLKEFKTRNYGLMPGMGGSYYERLQATSGQLADANLALREASNRRDELREQLEDEEDLAEDYEGYADVETSFDPRIQALQARMDDLLLRYTFEHPDVISVQETIAALEVQKQEEIEAGSGDSGPLESPVYQQLKLSLGEAEATVASIKARTVEFQRRIEVLTEQVDATLEVEAQFKALNRDYDVTRGNYNTLLARRETARMSQDADERAENVKFRIVDPPYVPAEASAPNRPLLASMVLLGGIIAGIGLALFLFLLRPTFDERKALKEITGLPVLGNLSMIWTAERQRQRRLGLAVFAMAGVALLAVYTSVLTIEFLGIDLGEQLVSIKEQVL